MTISVSVRNRVRQTFRNRCAYCQSAQQYLIHSLEIDHIIPLALGGTDDEDNLCLSCRRCNSYKGTQTHAIDPDTDRMTRLFNPREDVWPDHFRWSEDGIRIIGITSKGRATVNALRLNNSYAITARRNWVSVGWHPPE